MANSKGIAKLKRKALGRLFPSIAAVAEDTRTAARLETLELLMDIDQVTDLLASFDDFRQGRIVNMSKAFGDLSP